MSAGPFPSITTVRGPGAGDVYVSVNGGVPQKVTIPKPRLRILRDSFAEETGQPWACSQAGFIARGRTPREAFDKLKASFRMFRGAGGPMGRVRR